MNGRGRPGRQAYGWGRPYRGVKRLRIIVSGTVQGVWFRESTRAEAERLGVKGWVRNLPDGRVEAVLEGEPSAVDRLALWCRRGPEKAEVTDLESVEEPAEGLFASFGVRR